MNTLTLNDISNKEILNNCINKLKNGGVGIFPTDTVYGIGCDALNINALNKLFNYKERNFNKPINILVSNINMVKKYVKNINYIEQKLMENFWPGALTIIFDKSQIVPNLLTSNLDTVGIRMPNNPISLELIEYFGSALATSSANVSNKPANININEDLINNFNNKVNFIIDGGEIKDGVPSTIVRVDDNKVKILREGAIKYTEITKVLEREEK